MYWPVGGVGLAGFPGPDGIGHFVVDGEDGVLGAEGAEGGFVLAFDDE